MSEWIETRRVLRGVFMSEPGRGPHTVSYWSALYEVTERNGVEWRTRIIEGPPLYEHEHPEHTLAYEVTRDALPHILAELVKLP